MNQELFFSILNFPVVTFAIHSAVGKKPESIQDPNISKSDKDFKEKKIFLHCWSVFEMLRNFRQ